jgi:Protein of unknown function (DUF3160)
VHGIAVAPAPPLPLGEIAFEGGAAARWSGLSAEARSAVLAQGFAVVAHPTPSARFGRAYTALAEGGIPYVVTLDALFWIAHVARDRALAAVEERVLVPALEALLRRLETLLATDARGARIPGDLVQPYVLARGVVSVARSLLSPTYRPPADLARVVADENRRINAHEGPSVSPLLGITLDYSLIVPRGAADASAARAAYARATAWLDSAPFMLAARGEREGAELNTTQARAHTRAALLVGRLVEFEVDIEAAYAWAQWNAVAELVGGPSDELSLRGLLDAARNAGIDVRDARAFVDVAKVDHLRHQLLADRPSRLYDGAGLAGIHVPQGGPSASPNAPSPSAFTAAATSVRLFAPRAAADADLLQALVFPSVGKLIAAGDPSPPPRTARDGIRALPSALDVGAWLGSPAARPLLHDRGDDAYERYPETLDALTARRPLESARHDSIYSSSLDALATYVAPSAADAEQPGASSPPWQRRRLEAALAGWTTLRHDALAFTRFPLATIPPLPPAPHPRLASALPAFVEAHPEAIGKLVSLVRQTIRGLRALGQGPAGSPAIPVLDAAEQLLLDAFAIARREADDLPPSAEEREALLTFPARLAALEDALVPSRGADASLAVDVHTDLASARALVEGCGDLDDLYLVFREPGSGRLVLAVGATASHYEVTEHLRDRPTDTTWRSRLHGPSPPPRGDATRALPVPGPEPEPEPPDASATD